MLQHPFRNQLRVHQAALLSAFPTIPAIDGIALQACSFSLLETAARASPAKPVTI